MTALPIDMVSDVVCPWCFIGKRRLEKAIALKTEISVEVRFRPYFLNPWVVRDGISRETGLIDTWRARAEARATEAYSWDRVTDQYEQLFESLR